MTKDKVLEILNQTNIKKFKERLEKEGFNKDKLLLYNNLDFNKTYTITKENLILFLEENLDLNNEIFIDDLENFTNEENNEDLLLNSNKILEYINKQISQISEQDNYDWEPEDFIDSDNN
ncbi:16710_t:CDS:1 [Cetraspora pellucida]|uniref:16710_t:CDS:1 n=1 Tax=Cetraspora pellucida TaxID=1433469 RepID=A0A9N9KFF0_9GLOM|nr:16710_t:CDS:1 [Cetraspora pellucida]